LTDWSTARWSLYAPIYDAIGGLTSPARRRSLELLAPRPGERLLVVGCGTGLDFGFLPPGVAVDAIDASPAMAQRAARRGSRLVPPARVQVMDATALEFADGSFDAAVLHLILAVLPAEAAGLCLREVARVLRPGGRVGVFDKFVPGEDCRPGRARRALDLAARAAATRITACLEALVEEAPFSIEHQEPSLLRGQFRIAILSKREPSAAAA
jgi:phosphatidylethanolamine/phosphatidyl-N-methylethanolamine N-methyltransferase